jgi:hypothetical protein
MNRLIYLAIVPTIFAIMVGSTGCNNKVTISRSLGFPIFDNYATTGRDNFTDQSENTTSSDVVTIFYVDRTGKQLRNESSVITLTAEQEAEIQRQIELKTKLKDPDKIRYRSGYSMNIAAGTIDENVEGHIAASENSYYVIQFFSDLSSVDKDTRDKLEQLDCILLDPVENNAFFIKIPPEALDTVISLVKSGKVRYLGRIPMEAKIKPSLLTKAQANHDTSFEVGITLFDKANPSQINSLKDIMKVDNYYDVANAVFGTVTGNRIQDIIDLSFVEWIEEQGYSTLSNDGASAITETQEYLVVFNIITKDYKNQVLAINGVKHFGDANYVGINNEEYPAIVIAADPSATEQIKMLDFVVAVSPIDSVPSAPIPPQDVETTKVINTWPIIIASIAAILVLAIIMILYLIKRRRIQA